MGCDDGTIRCVDEVSTQMGIVSYPVDNTVIVIRLHSLYSGINDPRSTMSNYLHYFLFNIRIMHISSALPAIVASLTCVLVSTARLTVIVILERA